MNVEFKNSKLQKLAEDQKKLEQKYGRECAELILISLNYLAASFSLLDIPHALRPHPLKGNYKGMFALDVKHPYRVIIQPIEDFNINDYSTIKSIMVIDLHCDYH